MSEPRKPFDFFDSPWWKDMNEKLCADGWPHVVVPLNCMVNEAMEAYDHLKTDLLASKLDVEHKRLCIETLKADRNAIKNRTAELEIIIERINEILRFPRMEYISVIHEVLALCYDAMRGKSP